MNEMDKTKRGEPAAPSHDSGGALGDSRAEGSGEDSPPPTEGAATSPWDQRLARIVVRPLIGTGVRPNYLTTLSLLLGVIAAGLFSYGDPAFDAVAALIYMLAVFSDHMDGELARATGKTSRFGHIYDFLAGCFNYTLLFIGIGIGQSGGDMGNWALVLGFGAGFANPLIVSLRIAMERRFGAASVRHPAAFGFEIEDFIYLIGPITWAGGIVYFFVVYGIGTLGYLLWTVGRFVRCAR
jgi:phosphatidylglycerophosphate synthase